MKVTVKENKVDEIDFSVAGQLLTLIDNGSKYLIVITNGCNSDDEFTATVVLNQGVGNVEGSVSKGWRKKSFKKFNGTITIEQ
jgi:hypothetical protein